jgi:large subunit ribosomal protein L21
MNTNYAVVNIFGRQFKVSVGDKVKANFVDADIGTTLPFSEVLMLNQAEELKIGAPYVSGAKVTAEVLNHGREDKILVFKYLRKHKSKKMYGHKQPYTMLSIKAIEGV